MFIVNPFGLFLEATVNCGHPRKKSGTPARKPVKRTVWEDRQQTAFEELKTMLTKPPILDYADYTNSFILHTDASSMGLGAVLYQNHDGIERVVGYASRFLRQTEKLPSTQARVSRPQVVSY